jgi:hypothetical protein
MPVVSLGVGLGAYALSAVTAVLSCATKLVSVGAGVAPIVVSLVTAVVSVAVTAVVSPRSGAAPTSSSGRLWQAASDAAAASIKKYLISVLLGPRDPARLRVSAAVVDVPRAIYAMFGRAVTSASRECTPGL